LAWLLDPAFQNTFAAMLVIVAACQRLENIAGSGKRTRIAGSSRGRREEDQNYSSKVALRFHVEVWLEC
jgi:hypothetical protein